MLWLALHFPRLPLEALPLRQSPSAVVARGRVVTCDAAATMAGVCAGQRLSTALGMAPALAVFERDARCESAALHDLACWAGQFTPDVHLAAPDLLLEIGACRRLFGGAAPLVEAVIAGAQTQAWSLGWAAAPTPRAALWLARAGLAQIIESPAAMQAALAELPCAVAGWPAEINTRLDAFGLRRLGDLHALPGSGLRQRIGSQAVDECLQAWGDLPDRRRFFVFPEKFVVRLELPSRVEHAEGLLFAGQRLLSSLAGWLHARQRLLRRCSLVLTHDDLPATCVPLQFAEPTADEARFVRLLRERLGRLALAGPVEALALQADEVVARPDESLGLFATAPVGEGAQACLERLQARLGEAAVLRPVAQADFRPECATRLQSLAGDFAGSTASTAATAAARPLWLLSAPQALDERAGTPCWHGPLQLLSSPERLESGWWDEDEPQATGDVRRDYFVARNPLGQLAWVFRDAGGWFLHGLFA